ncbi:MAG: formylglycine-generating enzyme family protein [Candidatus Poribacteria bacterium]|mgnify:FL=1
MKFAIIIAITVSIFLIVGISIAQKDSQQTTKKSTNVQGKSNKPKEIIGKDGAKMVLIPAGEFQMGTDPSEIPELVKLARNQGSSAESWFEDETPRHTVYMDAFYMDVYEVTNAQYKKFVQATGHKEPEGNRVIGNLKSGFKPWQDKNYNGDNQPVVCVRWEDAKAYAEWAGKQLPTEAEWEYAARGGLAGKRYVWGDEWPPPKNSCNFADETLKKAIPYWKIIDGYDDGYIYTAPVGSYKPNGYGLYDMAGNVWEWCADWYNDRYYARSLKSNPKGSDSGQYHVYRVLRGGSWHLHSPLFLRVAACIFDPAYTYVDVGFRCSGLSVTP